MVSRLAGRCAYGYLIMLWWNHAQAGSLALLTDLYQLTMAYAYWKCGTHEKEAVFHMLFRHHPFQGGFTIACGLHDAIAFLKQFRFTDSDLEYLGHLPGADERPL